MLSERTSLDVDDIIGLLIFCPSSTYFSFHGNFYHLTDGMAMGLPVSSAIANMFLEDLESKALEMAAHAAIAPHLWERYINDVFELVKRQCKDA